MARKSEVYSWRVAPALKASLEDAASRAGRRSVAELLEQIVSRHLTAADTSADGDAQRRLHARAAHFAGVIRGRAASRASRAKALVRNRLRRLRRVG